MPFLCCPPLCRTRVKFLRGFSGVAGTLQNVRMNGDGYMHDARWYLQILHHPIFLLGAPSSNLRALRPHLSLVTYQSAQVSFINKLLKPISLHATQHKFGPQPCRIFFMQKGVPDHPLLQPCKWMLGALHTSSTRINTNRKRFTHFCCLNWRDVTVPFEATSSLARHQFAML